MKDKNILEEIKRFVEEECKKSNLGNEILVNHLVRVVEHARKLAENLGADLEIVELAAWLHDIGSIIHGRKNHHVTSSEIARKKLKELGYPKEKIEKVRHCILVHRGSNDIKPEIIEAKILIEVDALPCFDCLEGQFLWAIERDGVKNKQELGKIIREKLINKWNQLSSESKELIKPKFDAAMLLLK